MKRKLLLGILCSAISLSAMSQTITAPVGQSLIITNPVNVTGGSIGIPADSSFKIAGKAILNTKGNANVFLGEGTGMLNSGYNNIFLGVSAGRINAGGSANTFIGTNAGYVNTTGNNNMFLGVSAGEKNTTADYNSFIGVGSGRNNSTGIGNSFIGYNSGNSNVSGQYNSALGLNAGNSNTGNDNTFVGTSSGYYLSSGNNNTFIGSNAGGSTATNLNNSTAIGANASVSTSNTVVLGNAATTITGQGLAAGASGLRFANLNSSSATVASGGSSKVLSVDASGNVVLVALSGATTTSAGSPVAESTWKNADGYLYNNSTNGVVINGAGLDGNALIVKGGVLSKEVNVKVEGAESWPDYVFKPSYKRMSLEEVDKFIAINGHLPNVPSATEMAVTGNNLNKTDIKLLEKVEELTLYLLEMKKANDAQSAEIQSLKNQMSKLKKNRK